MRDPAPPFRLDGEPRVYIVRVCTDAGATPDFHASARRAEAEQTRFFTTATELATFLACGGVAGMISPLLAAVNGFIDKVKADGRLATAFKKYAGVDLLPLADS